MASKDSALILDLQKHYELLKLEYEYEKEEFRKQLDAAGIPRRVKRGTCWFPVSLGKSYYNSVNQFVVEIERTEDKEIEHNFEYGRPVCFFFQNPSTHEIHYLNQIAYVSYVNENRMVVSLPSNSFLIELQNKNYLGVQLYFDETSYQTMFEALRNVIQAKGNQLSKLRDKLIGTVAPETRTITPMRFPWVNVSQEKAINKILAAKDIAIVHGPPGTGKTTTLVETIHETLHRENQVLVCAQSNTAVDWISEKLVDRGINVLRIGNPTRVNDKMLSFTYERRFEAHPDYTELWALRKNIREHYQRLRKGNEKDAIRNKIDKLKQRCTELEIRINESLFSEARVIASTLVGSANRVLIGKHFPTLFIDEAAQALEAACWIAIQKADRVILAGDHQQLPPTIKCIEAARGGLDCTLMQKVIQKKPQTVAMLTTQYRMHEDIMKFSSGWFYDNLLQAAPEVKYRGILDYDTPIIWHDTAEYDFKEEFVGESFGRINKEEAELLVSQLINYAKKISIERILEEHIDFGIISPYRAQIQYLKRLLQKSPELRPIRHLISINTVDGFQGQERDIILITLVRSNEKKEIGFLHDLRRMNVAITRARMKLIIIGNASTLTQYPFYKKFHEYIMELNS